MYTILLLCYHFIELAQWNREAADGQFRKPASNAKLASLLQKSGVKFEFTPFETGKCTHYSVRLRSDCCFIALQETVDWFVSNYQNARIGQVS